MFPVFRSAVFYVLWTLWTILFLAVIAIAVFCSARNRYALMAIWSRWVIRLCGWCCGIYHRVEGGENIPAAKTAASRPVVFLCRHESTWETIALQTILPPHATVLKKELYRIPIFGWGARLMGMIAIDRQAGRQALKTMLQQGQHATAHGRHLLVFPEGRRMHPNERGAFFVGGAWLAKQLNADVIPISVASGHLWQRQSWIKKPGQVCIRIGTPTPTASTTPQQINEQAKQFIDQYVEGKK